jgi:hypothetical protein
MRKRSMRTAGASSGLGCQPRWSAGSVCSSQPSGILARSTYPPSPLNPNSVTVCALSRATTPVLRDSGRRVLEPLGHLVERLRARRHDFNHQEKIDSGKPHRPLRRLAPHREVGDPTTDAARTRDTYTGDLEDLLRRPTGRDQPCKMPGWRSSAWFVWRSVTDENIQVRRASGPEASPCEPVSDIHRRPIATAFAQVKLTTRTRSQLHDRATGNVEHSVLHWCPWSASVSGS